MPPQFADVLAQLQVLAFGVGDAFVHRLELAVHVIAQRVDRVHDLLGGHINLTPDRRLPVRLDARATGRLQRVTALAISPDGGTIADAVEDADFFIHHDEACEIYVNGIRSARLRGFSSDYKEQKVRSQGKTPLRPGKNLIAVHVNQTTGGQYFDLGFVKLVEKKR